MAPSFSLRRVVLILTVLLAAHGLCVAQRIEENVRTDTIEPFILEGVEVQTGDPFGPTSLLVFLNQFHANTHESVVRDEIFLDDGDTVTQVDLDEIERNLRMLDIFSVIRLELVQLELEEGEEMPVARLKIITRDSWSLKPSASYRVVENNERFAVGLRETNLAGIAQQIGAGIEYGPDEEEKFRFSLSALEQNIAGTHLRVGAGAAYSGTDKAVALSIDRPFYSDRAPDAFALSGGYYSVLQGFYFNDAAERRRVSPVERTDAAGWYSLKRAGSRDVFRSSIRVTVNRTIIDSAGPFQRAFDNSVGVFGGISSVRRRYVRFRDVDFNGDLQVPIGGMGNVTLGKISPIYGGLDNVIYLGAEARQSHLFSNRLYLFGAIAAGTGLSGKQSRFTIQRFNGGGLFLVDPGVLAVRLLQSTVWNWPSYLMVPLDKENGLRGYEQLELFGDNRLLANVEYRLFPILSAFGYRLGVTGFYDIGGVWDQGRKFSSTRFHSSLGIGFRLGSRGGNVGAGVYRLDFAWGLDADGRSTINKLIAGIGIGTSEFMSPFGSLDHVPPGYYSP